MRWIVAPLLIAAGLLALVIIGARLWWRHCVKIAGRVGLLEHQPSTKPIKGYLWLADREMEKWMSEQKRKGLAE